jgi:hypothetical protein
MTKKINSYEAIKNELRSEGITHDSFPFVLGRYFDKQKSAIISDIEDCKKYFNEHGGADTIVLLFQNSLLEFKYEENSEENHIYFSNDSFTQAHEIPNQIILTAVLYLLFVTVTLNKKYHGISERRSKLVSALTQKNFQPEKFNDRFPLDLSNKNSEISEIFTEKKRLLQLAKSLKYLSSPLVVNPDLKYYVDTIPSFFPQIDLRKVYIAASLSLTQEEYKKFCGLSFLEREKFCDEISVCLPIQAWQYWNDEVDDFFAPYL